MLRLVLEAVRRTRPDRILVVAGAAKNGILAESGTLGAGVVEQSPPRGTAHAVLAARRELKDNAGEDILIVPADLPLLGPAALKAVVGRHRRKGNALTVMSAVVSDPSGYGRIIRRDDGRLDIVEEAEASPRLRAVREVNTGVYVFRTADLVWALPRISDKNASREYYLTDALRILAEAGRRVDVFPTRRPEDIVQVNTRADLARAIDALRLRKIRALAEEGVTVLSPGSTWIDLAVKIGRDTVIYPSAVIEGATTIGRRCRIYPGAHLRSARIGNDVQVLSSTVIEDATLEDDVRVGPFARLRPKTHLRPGSRVGNFVEMKNTDFGRGAKAMHLTYLGDSRVGEGVNVGAGTITCNYDGLRKNTTIIEAGAFIGSGTELIAPVKVGRGAYVAAGSTITKDVAAGALAVARARQFERPGWAKARREKSRGEPCAGSSVTSARKTSSRSSSKD
jgi:bifunctional UDP-N-acetylglucosamine pyrophosphorylase/glucosamine-1-phosphate N-acetyltransferase